MPRRRSNRNNTRPRRGRGRPQCLDLVGHGTWGAGAGQINIPWIKLDPPPNRAIRPTTVQLQICLRSDTATVPSESISVYLYGPSGVVSRYGPILLDTRARKFNFRWPYVPPFVPADTPTAKNAVTIYDYGDNSKAGMVVTVRIRCLVTDASISGLQTGERQCLSFWPPAAGVSSVIEPDGQDSVLSVASSFRRLSI